MWKDIATAPKDGTWFLVLRPITIIGGGKPTRAAPEIDIIHRKNVSPTSGGYWSSIRDHSVADHYLESSMWAHLDELPLDEMWERIEAKRQRQGGDPHPLPMPLGVRTETAQKQPTSTETNMNEQRTKGDWGTNKLG